MRSLLSPRAIERDLRDLSRNLWWSWSADARRFWQLVLDASHSRRAAKEHVARNPVALLQTLDARDFLRLATSAEYVELHRRVMRAFQHATGPSRPLAGLSRARPVAYFSMEFGVHESLPVYAGGLGILAGDHAKSASDLALPLVGVGLFYHQGYFRQELDANGEQRVVYPQVDIRLLPLEPLRDARTGKEIRVVVEILERAVKLKVWRLRVGRVDLLLLDADVPENRRQDRALTNRLYGGSREDRLRQEIAAGIGGVRALRAAGIRPGVWHLNEGHVAFLALERLRQVREELGLSFAESVEVIAADTVFTTHTPVPEGNEVFDLALAARYLEPHARRAGIALQDFLALGLDHGADGRPFLSMTALALRLSRFRNGVSRLHGEVARRMWSRLWPGFRPEDVPITSVTNGIHTPSWIAPQMDRLFRERLAEDWERHLDDAAFWRRTSRLPERELWSIKQELKAEMVRFVRRREDERLARLGWSAARRRAAVESLLDPEVFTIGFARRFALYKRAALLFSDLGRAARLFRSTARPLQVVFSGKPHPEDPQGKVLFERIAALTRRREFRGRVVLVENYDIEVARHLVQGVDLWLNSPRRPLEASGTSGQKVPANAGLNLSILDGWWDEGWSPQAGWAFGKPLEYADRDVQDDEDAADLYRVLECEVLPLYYRRDRSGVPAAWFRKVKTSMAELVPRFSTAHMVGEYARRLYLPALAGGEAMRARGARAARDLALWRERVETSWPLVHLRGAARRGRRVEVEVYLAGLSAADLACRDDAGDDRPLRGRDELGPGLWRLEIDVNSSAAPRRVLLYPTHARLLHSRELGLTLEIWI